MELNLIELTHKYFNLFLSKNPKGLEELYSEDITLTDWNPQNVQWFDNYLTMWDTVKNEDPLELSETYGVELSNKLGLPMNSFDADQSKFFKRHYGADKYNKGPLVKEMDEVRRIQGW